ncbi:alpha/beta hydrolase family protein [Pseudoalteromonas sp. S16_S37]|uniref:alpha/beta hydrolase family protein n=1 Tax=Pseudoalteromonas sp. S16_S37 TaxID=2720228 RepID=UPI00168018EA|nr:alpha/beta fold hydrolase [Pseudoalteromonas sp. S16_S37]MBD1580781.1 alpha/beta fold hydrolase [Pseudoalteromonas sp. S16_S37]
MKIENIAMHSIIKIASVLSLGLVIAVIWFSNYDRHAVEIASQEETLYGSVVLPKLRADKPVPVVIFVHGDGPISSGGYGYYHPLWQALAQAGVASLSWDKQGVGGSSGHWLEQNMTQRAEELSAAIDWISTQPKLDSQRIGVIGFSQAGWVLPTVLAQDKRVKYAIMVSTAVNWEQQGHFQTVQRLKSLGQDGEVLAQNLDYNSALDELLKQRVPYKTYQQFITQNAPQSYGGKVMSPSRYEFVINNMHVDASATLNQIQQPVLALFGDSDQVVDVQQSIDTYQSQLSGPFSYKVYENADHGLFKNEYFSGISKDSIWFGVKMNWLGADGLTEQFVDDVLRWVTTHTQLDAQGVLVDGE